MGRFSGINTHVRFCKTILALLLALAWAPLTAHCELESVTGLDLLRCQPAQETPAPESSRCGGSACCAWELAQYPLPHKEPLILPQLLAVLPAPALAPSDDGLARAHHVAVPTVAPPELAGTWQFFWRAALPIRAPSFAS